MTLSDKSIRVALDRGRIIIEPRPETIQPTSVDLHLGSIIIDEEGNRTDIAETGWIMGPGEFLLASVAERVALPGVTFSSYVGILMGKSSLARLGLQVEAAGYVDPGWDGELTLELKNLRQKRSIALFTGMKICQIRFEQVEGEVLNPYGSDAIQSHYQNSVGPVEASRHGVYSPLRRVSPRRDADCTSETES